jgi:hypothetical protein
LAGTSANFGNTKENIIKNVISIPTEDVKPPSHNTIETQGIIKRR